MFTTLTKKSPIHNILIISLSNIGDIIAVCPAMDILLNDFPGVEMSILVGPKGKTVFEGNPHLKNVDIYDKHAPLKDKAALIKRLRQDHFDLIVDFRNSLIPYFLKARYRTPLEHSIPRNLHLVQKHLARLRNIYRFEESAVERKSIAISRREEDHVDQLLRGFIHQHDRFVLVAPLAADSAKTWDSERFAIVCDEIIRRHQIKVVMVGGSQDLKTIEHIQNKMSHTFLNLAGKTNLVQVAELLRRSEFVLVHDSGIMHLASYLGRKALALFGPTDPGKSAPWSEGSGYIWKNRGCVKCLNPKSDQKHTCMEAIRPEDVLNSIEINATEIQLRTISQK